jgi:hypothetical protein
LEAVNALAQLVAAIDAIDQLTGVYPRHPRRRRSLQVKLKSETRAAASKSETQLEECYFPRLLWSVK